jgi:predicted RNA binding protein YcfA (HicA-like mRNA interferase family)
MAAVGKKEAVRSICRKGFKAVPKGTHHLYYEYIEGINVVSHGSEKDLPACLIRKMADDCHLSIPECIAFAKCRMSEAEYRAISIRKGLILGPQPDNY